MVVALLHGRCVAHRKARAVPAFTESPGHAQTNTWYQYLLQPAREAALSSALAARSRAMQCMPAFSIFYLAVG